MDSSNGSSSTPIDVHEIINTQFITYLEHGIIPWHISWDYGDIPRNLISGRAYGGINLWSLLVAGYERNLFLSWEQIKAIGGSVNKGETGHIVAYWQKRDKQAESKKGGLRYYKVFNIAQCTDIRADLIPPLPEPEDGVGVLERCEAIVHGYTDGPSIVHKGKKMAYDVHNDVITIPPYKHFKEVILYYEALFRPLVSSTGTQQRLNRKAFKELELFPEGSVDMEGLIADMGSSLLCSTAGIVPERRKDVGTTIESWLPIFKKDKRFLIQAASQAHKAANYILNVKEAEVTDEAEEERDESVVR